MSAYFKITVSPTLLPDSSRDLAITARSRRMAVRGQSEISFEGDLAGADRPVAGKIARRAAPTAGR